MRTKLPRFRPKKPSLDRSFFHRQQFNRIKQGSQLPPSTRWVWTANGTSFGEFPEQSVNSASTLMLKFSDFENAGTYRRFVGNNTFTFSVDTGVTGDEIRLVGCTATLDGVAIQSTITPVPTDSDVHTIIATPTVGAVITRVMTRSDSATLCAKAKLWEYQVLGMVGGTHYPSKTATFPMDTYAPDNNYQFIDSDNGVVMQLFNALPQDFAEELI